MTGWDREYLANKEEYLKLFDKTMQKEQEQNVEFLEDSLKKITGRKYAVACSNGTDALHFALISLGIKRFDDEGRVIITEHENFLLYNIYFPNGQKDKVRLKFKMDFYDELLPII